MFHEIEEDFKSARGERRYLKSLLKGDEELAKQRAKTIIVHLVGQDPLLPFYIRKEAFDSLYFTMDGKVSSRLKLSKGVRVMTFTTWKKEREQRLKRGRDAGARWITQSEELGYTHSLRPRVHRDRLGVIEARNIILGRDRPRPPRRVRLK